VHSNVQWLRRGRLFCSGRQPSPVRLSPAAAFRAVELRSRSYFPVPKSFWPSLWRALEPPLLTAIADFCRWNFATCCPSASVFNSSDGGSGGNASILASRRPPPGRQRHKRLGHWRADGSAWWRPILPRPSSARQRQRRQRSGFAKFPQFPSTYRQFDC
uniref:Myotubularin phosphatase domain-containing protein n=1 Tax=Macrostomum lignano TaxID=282301 RepID=A0A1I8FNC1_9PLAT